MKRNTLTRKLAWLLALALLVGALGAAVYAEEPGEDGGGLSGDATGPEQPEAGGGGGSEAGEEAVTITGFAELDGAVRLQGFAAGGVTPADLVLPETLEATGEGDVPLTVEGVDWECTSPETGFDGDADGRYTFTARLPGGYVLADGVAPLAITVILRPAGGVARMPAAAVTVSDEGALASAISAFNGGAGDVSIAVGGVVTIDTALPEVTNSSHTLTLTGGGTLKRGSNLSPSDPVLKVTGGALVLENITLDGQADPGTYTWSLVNVDGSLAIKSGAVLQNNYAGVHGGAVRLSSGSLVMEGGVIRENASQFGGGVFVGSSASFTMAGGSISGNTAFYVSGFGGGDGGGVYVSTYGSFTLENGSISGNTADTGGGVYNFGGNFIMDGGSVTGNAVTGEGGGVYSLNRTFSMTGGQISGNSASRGGGVYGGNGNQFTMSGGTVTGNTASGDGGGVYSLDSGISMTGGEISGNASAAASGVYSGAGNTFTMTGGLIYSRGGGVADVVYDADPSWTPTVDGIVICWTGANAAQYASGSATGLQCLPAGAAVRWEDRNGVRGIAYEAGGANGFIPVWNLAGPAAGTASTAGSSRSDDGGGTAAAATGRSTVDIEHLGGYRFRADLPALGFAAASVDGEPLTRGEDYTIRSGSTVLSLTGSFVDSLSAGTHTLRMEFLSAVGSTEFTVAATGAGGEAGSPAPPELTGSGNGNMNPSTGGGGAGSLAVLLAVAGLWAVLPKRGGR